MHNNTFFLLFPNLCNELEKDKSSRTIGGVAGGGSSDIEMHSEDHGVLSNGVEMMSMRKSKEYFSAE